MLSIYVVPAVGLLVSFYFPARDANKGSVFPCIPNPDKLTKCIIKPS